MENSNQIWAMLAVVVAWVISFIVQQLLLYRAFLHAAPSVTMRRVAWTHWIFLRRDEFTATGWRYRQAALACWAVPLVTFFVAEGILNL